MADGKKTDSYSLDMEKLDAEGDRFRPATPTPPSRQNTAPPPIANHPMLPIISYCGSSILMTVTNKYCLSGLDFNLNFFLLCVQVCSRHSPPFSLSVYKSSQCLTASFFVLSPLSAWLRSKPANRPA
jgi:hypothetical protein